MKRMPRKRATRCQMAELVAKKCRSTTGETLGGHAITVRITIPLTHHWERHGHEHGRTQQGASWVFDCDGADASARSCAAHSAEREPAGGSNGPWRRTHCCQADQRLWGCAGADAHAAHSEIKLSFVMVISGGPQFGFSFRSADRIRVAFKRIGKTQLEIHPVSAWNPELSPL